MDKRGFEDKKMLYITTQELCDKMQEEVKLLTDDELYLLYRDCHNVSETNCWWFTYDIANPLKKLIEDEKRRRMDHEV